jgi:MinD-like ATPase involved in chromosome partitioning or flagellar assembly
VQRLLADRAAAAPPRGYQILVLRLTEGAGATTLATNLALCLAREECLAVVADGVLQGGQIENRLGLPLGGSWQDEPRSDADGLATYLLRHESGLFVLPTSPPKEGPVTPARLAQALQTLREWYDYVVVDTPFNLGSLAPVLVRSSAMVLLLVTPAPAVLQTAQTSLAAIRRLGAQGLKIMPVLQLRGAEEGFEQQVEEALGLSVAASLPWSPEECTQAMVSGEPVVLSYPDSRLTAAFDALAQVVVQSVQEQRPKRLLR